MIICRILFFLIYWHQGLRLVLRLPETQPAIPFYKFKKLML